MEHSIHISELIRNYSLVLAAAIGLPLAIWRSSTASKQANAAEKQAEISKKVADEQIFLDAIKLFESTNADVRIGAIHALQRIALINEEYYEDIIKVFCTFIRNNSNNQRKGKPYSYVRPDIDAVLDALRTRKIEFDDTKKRHIFLLNGSYLAGTKLTEINLSKANFEKSNLEFADLRRSDFSQCRFDHSKLTRAHFAGSNLFGASFRWADLTLAEFYNNDLDECSFHQAILIGTSFEDVKIESTERFIENLISSMIVYEDSILANHQDFHSNDKDTPTTFFQDKKDELCEYQFDSDLDLNTKFPDQIKVIRKGEYGFDLEFIEDKK